MLASWLAARAQLRGESYVRGDSKTLCRPLQGSTKVSPAGHDELAMSPSNARGRILQEPNLCLVGLVLAYWERLTPSAALHAAPLGQ